MYNQGMTLRHASSTPIYRQIADTIRSRIVSGELAQDAQLPTEHELAEHYGSSRQTVRAALKELTSEGLIVAKRPHGYFVRGRKRMVYRPQQEKEPRISAALDRFMAALIDDGRSPSQTIDVAIVTAPAFVSERLTLPAKSQVVVRKRVRYIDGEPFNINDTYYPYEIARDSEIMSPDDIPRGSNNVLAELGYPEVRAIDEFYVRMPTPDEVHRLDLISGTPVAEHFTTGYTASDQPIRCEFHILPGDRHVIVYERFHQPEAELPTTAS